METIYWLLFGNIWKYLAYSKIIDVPIVRRKPFGNTHPIEVLCFLTMTLQLSTRLIWRVHEFLFIKSKMLTSTMWWFLILSLPFMATYKIPQFVQSFPMRRVYEVAAFFLSFLLSCSRSISLFLCLFIALWPLAVIVMVDFIVWVLFDVVARNYCDQN